MKYNKWTLGLMAVGAVSFASATSAKAVEASMNRVETALSGVSISGYVDTSIEWGADPTGSDYQNSPGHYIPYRGSDKQDGFNLNVIKLTIEKPLDESEYASGFKADLLFGPDAVGYNTSVNAEASSDFGIKQAYVALRTPIGNGLVTKVGVFDAIIGYEVFEAGSNPNFTRSWAYAIEPAEHTGVLATYQFNDVISASAGVANTLYGGINARNTKNGDVDNYWDKTWMGSVTLTAPESWGSLAGSALYGGIVSGFNGRDDQLNLYAGTVVNTPIEGLTAGLAFDYTDFGTDNLDVFMFGLYASYKATDKLSFHGRAEVGQFGFEDDENDTEEDSSFFALTGTIQYDLWSNVISRIEVRYDSFEDAQEAGRIPEDASVLIAANIIYKF